MMWHLANTPAGLHLRELGDLDADELGAATAHHRAELGFPDDWVDLPDWDSSLTGGAPHQARFDEAVAVERLAD
jgi:hypothetical protein